MKSRKNPAFEELPVDIAGIQQIASSPQNGDADIYWISSGIIEELKRTVKTN